MALPATAASLPVPKTCVLLTGTKVLALLVQRDLKRQLLPGCAVVLSAGDLFRCSPLDAPRLVGHMRLEALLRECGASVESDEIPETPRCQH